MVKRTVAAMIAVLMLVLILPAAAVHNPEDTESVWQNGEELSMCFDTVMFGLPEGV